MTKREEYAKTLMGLVERAQAFCHKKTCAEPSNSCPQKCCASKLGLNTAIVWEAAALVVAIVSWADNKKTAQRLVDNLEVLLTVLEYHEDKFFREIELITDMWSVASKYIKCRLHRKL